MGDYPDKIEDIYCKKCGRVTEHKIYKKNKTIRERQVFQGELFQYDRNIDHNYTTRKQVCSACGKTKKKTTEDCCQII